LFCVLLIGKGNCLLT